MKAKDNPIKFLWSMLLRGRRYQHGFSRKNIRAGHPGAAGADTLEHPMALGAITLSQPRITPRIVHHDDAARFNARFGLLKADWTHLGPFLAPVHDDDIEPVVGNCVEVIRFLEPGRVF